MGSLLRAQTHDTSEDIREEKEVPLPKEAWDRVPGLDPSTNIFQSEVPAPSRRFMEPPVLPPLLRLTSVPTAHTGLVYTASCPSLSVCLSVVTCVQGSPVFIESVKAYRPSCSHISQDTRCTHSASKRFQLKRTLLSRLPCCVIGRAFRSYNGTS